MQRASQVSLGWMGWTLLIGAPQHHLGGWRSICRHNCRRCPQKQRGEKPNLLLCVWKIWSEWQDLNLRPPRPERGALPDCATLRLKAGLITPTSLKASLREAMTAEPGTRILKADQKSIETAAHCLSAGGLVAFPTETVYGLGADAGNGEAVARLFAAKRRPSFNPLIAHVADTGFARRIGVFNSAAEKLAAAFWPGPLTMVLAKQPNCWIADLALAGLDTVGLRVPAHPVAHALLNAFI